MEPEKNHNHSQKKEEDPSDLKSEGIVGGIKRFMRKGCGKGRGCPFVASAAEGDLVPRSDVGLGVLHSPDGMMPVTDDTGRGLFTAQAVFLPMKMRLVGLYNIDIQIGTRSNHPIGVTSAAGFDHSTFCAKRWMRDGSNSTNGVDGFPMDRIDGTDLS